MGGDGGPSRREDRLLDACKARLLYNVGFTAGVLRSLPILYGVYAAGYAALSSLARLSLTAREAGSEKLAETLEEAAEGFYRDMGDRLSDEARLLMDAARRLEQVPCPQNIKRVAGEAAEALREAAHIFEEMVGLELAARDRSMEELRSAIERLGKSVDEAMRLLERLVELIAVDIRRG